MLLVSAVWIMVTVSCFAQLRADINGDHKVNLLDVAILSGEWLKEEPMPNSFATFNAPTQGKITVPSNSATNLGTGEFSLTFWLRLPNRTSTGYIISKGLAHKDSSRGWTVKVVNNDFWFAYANGDGMASIRYAIFPMNVNWDNTFVFVSITADRTPDGETGVCDLIAYVNGVERIKGTPFAYAEGNLDTTSDVIVGRHPLTDSDYLSFSLYDFRLYKAVLTPAEILTIYNAGVPIAYNANQTPTSGAASFVMEFDTDFVANEIFSAVPSGAGKLTGTRTGGVTIEPGYPSLLARPAGLNTILGSGSSLLSTSGRLPQDVNSIH